MLVVADRWAEQRVLMRAFASCPDQTRPTIALHGVKLAIGPAGTDAHGSWGIHVEPPVDGRAQELRAQLELAARRLAGSKGNPPRLVDEARPAPENSAASPYYEPNESAQAPVVRPSGASLGREHRGWSSPVSGAPPISDSHPVWAAPSHAPPSPRNVKTVRGFALGPGALDDGTARPLASSETAGHPGAESRVNRASTGRLAGIIGKTMPPGFQLNTPERAVLDALGQSSVLSASQVAAIVGVTDGATWMQTFIVKLVSYGLDVIAHGGYVDGDVMYLLQH